MLFLGYEMERFENKNYGMKGVIVGNICRVGDKLKLLLRSILKVLFVGFFFYIYMICFYFIEEKIINLLFLVNICIFSIVILFCFLER